MNQENQEQKKDSKKLPGFYIALCCCVLAIGVAGYFTERYTKTQQHELTETAQTEATAVPVFSVDKSKSAITPTPYIAPDTSPAAADTAASGDIPVVSEPLDYAVDNPDLDESSIMVSSEQPAFIMPVNGAIIAEYSEKLIYNEPLSDWRTHDGVDIAADLGCSVQSAAAGIVEDISSDVMGNCVTISHAAGFITKYMGLENVENLTVGKEIQSGEVIGTVGSCKGENTKESHLHFEMTKDGVIVNPYDFLPHE